MAKLIPSLLCTALAGTPALAEAIGPGTADLSYGYFCALEPVEEGVAEGTISGTVSFVSGRPEFLVEGAQVPAQIGVGFGVHVRALPSYAGSVDVYIEHPPMGPDGVTQQVWHTAINAIEESYLGYSFDLNYELVRGPWTMRAESEGRVVYEVTFDVVDPSLLPRTECGPVPVS